MPLDVWRCQQQRRRISSLDARQPPGTSRGYPRAPALPGRRGGSAGGSGRAGSRTRLPSTEHGAGGGGPAWDRDAMGMLVVPGPLASGSWAPAAVEAASPAAREAPRAPGQLCGCPADVPAGVPWNPSLPAATCSARREHTGSRARHNSACAASLKLINHANKCCICHKRPH